ncbi:MAG: nucleoside 2-deoxyribosyltransferase [Candidatus Thorarchaeota archaeon]
MTFAYLSGPIIHANLRKDEFYQAIVNYLESRGIRVFAPQFLKSDDPAEIYTRDVQQVRKCDFLIGEVSNPSLGVGMEIMLAIELGKPVILFRNRSSENLSRMVLGADGKVLFEYSSIDEVIENLEGINLAALTISTCPLCPSKVGELTNNRVRCISCSAYSSYGG